MFSYSLIKDIKEKDSLNYADCIQLAILYAQYDEKPDNVYYWLQRSQELNLIKSCETLSHFIEKDSFKLNDKFKEELENLLLNCKD